MIDTKAFLRIPYNFQNKCKVYTPSIEEVFSDEHFNLYKTILCISQEDIQDEYTEKKIDIDKYPTPLEYLLSNTYKNNELEQIMCKGFEFFIHEPVTFLYEIKAIVIGKIDEIIKNIHKITDLVLITEKEYFDFQNTIRLALGEQKIEPPNPDENPKITRMKAKARYRDRIKAKKGVSGGISLQTSLEALCCIGIGLTPLNIGQISYAAVGPLMSRYQLKDKYETDVKSLLAGAKPNKVHPVYWIKDD